MTLADRRQDVLLQIGAEIVPAFEHPEVRRAGDPALVHDGLQVSRKRRLAR
jgi:hypothetical protein